MHADRRRVRTALGVLLVIGLVAIGGSLVLFSRSLAGIRGDFCAFTREHYAATLLLPQVPARVAAEQSDLKLIRQLDCD